MKFAKKYQAIANNILFFIEINIRRYKIYFPFMIFLLFFHFFILLINIFLLLNKNFINISIFNKFKNIDYFTIKFLSYSYNQITNYLIKKLSKKSISKSFASKKILKEIINNNRKKNIKLYYLDIHPRWISLIRENTKEKFNIQIDRVDPDYLVYATFGCKHLSSKYKNTIKIAFFTENQIPDLEISDYAVGLAHLNYLDRYFIYPYFIYSLNKNKNNIKIFEIIKEKILTGKKRKKFCASVISNPYGHYRIGFINKLSKYKKIDMGGRYHNNIGRKIKDKINFLSSYKFSIAMENSEGDGYISEKIVHSFLAGTIPIYYGDYMIDQFINPKTYILIRNKNDEEKKIEYIKKIDSDDELYKNILKEKIFINENIIEEIHIELKRFLNHIFEQKKNIAKRIDNYYFDFIKK